MVDVKAISADDLQLNTRRVMKYVLVWCSAGKVDLSVDHMAFELKEYQLMTITSGQIHQVTGISKDAKGIVLEFSYDFFCKSDLDLELIFQNGLFCHFDRNEVITIHNAHFVQEQLMEIQEEINNQPFQFLTSIHSRIKLILVEINRSKIRHGHEIWKPDALFLKFLELVRSSFDNKQGIADYAHQLQTTVQKLNDLAKLHTGKTAQMVVYGLIASEAKRLLIYEDLTVKEIAYRLGFNDPFYFSNFFKKHIGVSPTAFRESLMGTS